jgi:hypothetical protein
MESKEIEEKNKSILRHIYENSQAFFFHFSEVYSIGIS